MVYLYFGGKETSLVSLESLHHLKCKPCWNCGHIGSIIFLLFNFRFGQEVKVKFGSHLCKYFLTINDLYNGAKIVNLPLAVVEI